MNPLFQFTKAQIISRRLNSSENLWDPYVEKAIDSYESYGSMRGKITGFVNNLAPLWEIYDKVFFLDFFKDYIKLESTLETLEESHCSHINHVIQEFILGYNVLTNSSEIKKLYNYECGKNNSRSTFGGLMYSWMAASLFHDVGYDIEFSYEEEEYRKEKNSFWGFLTQRPVASSPIEIDLSSTRTLICNIVLPLLNEVSENRITINELDDILTFEDTTKEPSIKRYDHGVISALKYLVELKKLQARHPDYTILDWKPNHYAILAMLLHNFRYKNIRIKLNSFDVSHFIPYLLIICDESQNWEREREDHEIWIDLNAQLIRKELTGIYFDNTHALITVNHKLAVNSDNIYYKEQLLSKIKKLKEDLPVQISVKNSRVIQSYGNLDDVISGILYGKRVELTLREWEERIGPSEEYYLQDNIHIIENIETIRNILSPREPPMYRLLVDHHIDYEPFITIEYSI